MPRSQADSATVAELEALMFEFPDWKEQFPEAYTDVLPQRFSKINRKGRREATEKKCEQRAATSVPLTDYQGTYKGQYQRPRSTKRPPPSPRDLHPPPMTFSTNQRQDYVPKDVRVRPDLIKMGETYEAPSGPLEGTTNYMKDYPGHQPPKANKVFVDPTHGQIKRSTGKFSSQTTTREHFRKWEPEHTLTFGELPTFTDSILYPSQKRDLATTTATTYKGRHMEPAELIPHDEGNIKLEGSHTMTTTHDLTYVPFASARPATKARPKDEKAAMSRTKFDSITQSQKDFPFYPGHQPPRPVDPAPTTIQLRYSNNKFLETEQQQQYPGIDVKSHPVPETCKKDNQAYKRPEVKFHTETNQKMDYKPVDVTKVYKPPIKQPTEPKRREQMPKFDGRTMNNTFFQRWEAAPRPRYGDFHEGHTYVAPAGPFEGASTTKTAFCPKVAEIQPNYKPENMAEAHQGDHDFNTMYKAAYVPPNSLRNLTKTQAAELLKELRQMKEGGHQYSRLSGHAVAAK